MNGSRLIAGCFRFSFGSRYAESTRTKFGVSAYSRINTVYVVDFSVTVLERILKDWKEFGFSAGCFPCLLTKKGKATSTLQSKRRSKLEVKRICYCSHNLNDRRKFYFPKKRLHGKTVPQVTKKAASVEICTQNPNRRDLIFSGS